MGAESPFDDVVAGLVLGGEAFLARCREFLEGQDLREAPRAQRHLGRPSLEEIFRGVDIADKAARNAAIVRAFDEHAYPMKAIAEYLSLHYSTVSVVLKKRMK